MSTCLSPTESDTSTCVRASGWQSGISSAVRFAAMIPASCAVASASPFGSPRSCRAVSGDMRTVAAATARRRDSGLPPTSTMRTSPASSTCESSLTRRTLAWYGRNPVEVGELGAQPRLDVVLADVRADRLGAPAPLVRGQLERRVNRLRLPDQVERAHAEHPLAQLLVGAGV